MTIVLSAGGRTALLEALAAQLVVAGAAVEPLPAHRVEGAVAALAHREVELRLGGVRGPGRHRLHHRRTLLAHVELAVVVAVQLAAHCCHGESAYVAIRDRLRAGVAT
eukprot:8748813-Pyramimonas_sp.AAC.2